MKILMVNLPFAGHSNPTMGLAENLVDLGHHVAYIHSYEWQDEILSTGSKFIPYYGTTPNKYKKMELSYWRLAYDTIELELPQYDVLIYEVLFFPGKSLADKFGKLAVRLFSTFALNPNILHEFGLTGGPYLTTIFRYRWLYKMVSTLACRSFELKEKDIIKVLTENSPDVNFVYTIRDFQIENEQFPESKYYFVGPSLSKRKEAQNPINFENLIYPLIYISMGTMINHSTNFYKKCIEAFGEKKLTVIISLGHSVGKELFDSVPENIQLYSFVPQLEVLEHCDLFITHGGMNSVNEAIYYGVPMLVIPIGNDQPTVAGRVEQLGLGKTMKAKNITAEALYNETIRTLTQTRQQTIIDEFQNKSVNAGGNQLAAKVISDYMEAIKYS